MAHFAPLVGMKTWRKPLPHSRHQTHTGHRLSKRKRQGGTSSCRSGEVSVLTLLPVTQITSAGLMNTPWWGGLWKYRLPFREPSQVPTKNE